MKVQTGGEVDEQRDRGVGERREGWREHTEATQPAGGVSDEV